VPFAAIKNIVSSVAEQVIVPLSTRYMIVASATPQPIVTTVPEQRVVAVKSTNLIPGIIAADAVVQPIPGSVDASSAGQG
jgi:hypothetical protein